MIAVPLAAADAEQYLGEDLCVAVINQPDGCVLAGPTESVRALHERLSASGMAARILKTSHAFHSSMMDGALPPFLARVAQTKLSPPSIPFFSNVTGTWITDAQATDPHYWASQLRQAVQFAPAVAELLREPSRVFVEV